MAEARPRQLALYGLGFAITALLVFAVGLLMGSELGLMGIGLIFLGLAAGALLGTIGLVLSGIALSRAEPGEGKGLAIAGLVVGLVPVALLLFVSFELRRMREGPPELPLEPPTELREPQAPPTPPTEPG